MELRVVLMGLLLGGPRHGYELKRLLEKDLSPLFSISSAPIYYTLRKLEEEGLVVKWTEVKGRRPQRYRYSLTPKGREEAKRLILKNITQIQRPLFNLDISLYFLNFVPSEEVLPLLRERFKELRKLRFLLRKQAEELRGDSSRRREAIIAAHNLRGVEAEIEFVKDLMEEFREEATEREAHDRR